MTFKWTVAAVSVLACITITGCVSRSHADVTVTGTTSISKGQELSDLQRALEAGAISPADYEKVRAKILKRDN